MKLNHQALAIIYIFTMTFAFNNTYGDYKYPLMVQIGIAFVWVLFAGMQYFSGGIKSEVSKNCMKLLKIYILSDFLIHLYSIILIVFGVVEWKYLTSNISTYVPTLLAISSIYLFKSKSIIYNCIALIISWFLSVMLSIAQHGFSIIKDAIIQGYIDSRYSIAGERVSNHFELHDIVLAVWYFIVFFLFSRKEFTKKQKKIMVVFIIIGLLGFKRVALIGVLFSVLFYCFVSKMEDRKKVLICKMTGWTFLVGAIVFVYLMYGNEYFYIFAANLKIDFMGRLWIYKQLTPFVTFSPTFLGLGRNSIVNWFREQTGYLLHSDILKMYAENGFFMFIFWLWYMCIHVAKKYKKHFGTDSMVVYVGLLVYTFCLYLTDNTENYFACKTLSILIPAYYALYHEDFKRHIKAMVKREQSKMNINRGLIDGISVDIGGENEDR